MLCGLFSMLKLNVLKDITAVSKPYWRVMLEADKPEVDSGRSGKIM